MAKITVNSTVLLKSINAKVSGTYQCSATDGRSVLRITLVDKGTGAVNSEQGYEFVTCDGTVHPYTIVVNGLYQEGNQGEVSATLIQAEGRQDVLLTVTQPVTIVQEGLFKGTEADIRAWPLAHPETLADGAYAHERFNNLYWMVHNGRVVACLFCPDCGQDNHPQCGGNVYLSFDQEQGLCDWPSETLGPPEQFEFADGDRTRNLNFQ